MFVLVRSSTPLYLYFSLCLLLPQLSYSNDDVPASPQQTSDTQTSQTDQTTGEPDDKSDSEGDGNKSEAENAALNATKKEMMLLENLGADPTLINNSVRFINYLLKTNRDDQDAVHQFARKVNRNLDKCKDCGDLPDKIRKINKKLITKSYLDSLLQNGNLSNQLATRLGELVSDSLLLQTDHNPSLRTEFEHEYGLIAGRYNDARRFRVGLGIDNSYLPSFRYISRSSLDFSAFQSPTDEGRSRRDRLEFRESFSNEVSTALLLSADTPYLKLNATFPNIVKTENATLPVEVRDIDDSDMDLLYRTKIGTSLEIDYDIGAVFEFSSIGELLGIGKLFGILGFSGDRDTEESFGFESRRYQGYWGFGVGATGIKVTENISNEIKYTTSDSSVFNELPTSSTEVSSATNSDLIPYVSLSYVFEISDEFKASFEGRKYFNPSRPVVSVDEDDIVISLQAVWYPTFNFQFPW